MTQRGILGAALALLLAAPVLGEEGAGGKIACKMQFRMKGWAAIYESAEGTGTITCSNGETIEVALESKGVGLAAGKAEFSDARGVFSPVERTEELLGTYLGQSGVAAAGKAEGAAAFVKGDVSLAVYGEGEGAGLSSGGARLTIARREGAAPEN
jgi:hypothetical protein